jgi:flagellar assembly protein FliH
MPSSDQDSLPLRWEIPSFDPPKPPKPPKNPPIQYPTVEEVEAIRANAYHEAYELGSNQGFIEGRESGYKEGQQKGYEEGYQKGYLDAHTETNRLHDALKELLLTLDGLPQAISEPLTQLAFEIGIRLSANESMERGPFVAAVQEALMRLPRPGESLYLRIRSEEVETWKKIVEDPGLPFTCSVLVDADVQAGHAYVEVGGARIDVGKAARKAMVFSALGLNPSDSSTASPSSVALAIDPPLLEDKVNEPPAY